MAKAIHELNQEIIILASSGEKELSYEEKNAMQAGLFSLALKKGLKGEADLNKDGKVDLNELFQYVELETMRLARSISRKQTPKIYGGDRELYRDIVLTELD